MYHALPRGARLWSLLFRDRPRSRGDDPQARVFLRRTPALRSLPPEATGHRRPAPRITADQTELLLRSRWLQEESDTAIGTLPRPKGLPRRRHSRDQRHAARADSTPSPRALQPFRRRPTDHRSLAGLLAGPLSADPVLESRTRPTDAGCPDRRLAILAGGRLPAPPGSVPGAARG